jgi:hypothetical protein
VSTSGWGWGRVLGSETRAFKEEEQCLLTIQRMNVGRQVHHAV